MSQFIVETVLPSLIVTLFSGGLLTVILRRNGFHALLGLVLIGWAVVLLLCEVAARSGRPEGGAMALLLTFLIALHVLVGWGLLLDWKKQSDTVDLES